MFKKISIALGGMSIFFIAYGIILELIIYRNDPNRQSYEEAGFNLEASINVPVGVCGIIAVMLFFIIKDNLLPFVGGIGMALLGLSHILVANEMQSEISWLLANGPRPYLLLFLMAPRNFAAGGLLLVSGLLAIAAGFKERRAVAGKKEAAAIRQLNNPGTKP